MHRCSQQKKEITSRAAPGSGTLFNIKATAAAAQALLETGLDDPLLLAASQYVRFSTLSAYNPDFYTQKKTPLSSLEFLNTELSGRFKCVHLF